MATTAEDTTAGTAGRMVNHMVGRMTTDAAITKATMAIMVGMPTNAVALLMKGGAERQVLPPQHGRA